MKRPAALTIILAIAFISSCGPSAEEIEARRILDSAITADSLAKIRSHQQRIVDSIAIQDSIKKVQSAIQKQ